MLTRGCVVKGDRQSFAPFSSSLRNKDIEPRRTRAIGKQAFHIGAAPALPAGLGVVELGAKTGGAFAAWGRGRRAVIRVQPMGSLCTGRRPTFAFASIRAKIAPRFRDRRRSSCVARVYSRTFEWRFDRPPGRSPRPTMPPAEVQRNASKKEGAAGAPKLTTTEPSAETP